ncbi:type VI secretion system protein TssL, short form [Serratia sp. DD3]|uniref:type VI secretion system protein TssL, short form n=1 Tax=Serratia sp. DD3 TaxID=1410619 RepID=UPI0003C4FC0E|nr:type VI secretion system protein TssL, short form [Serratia sp. DD3]KEY59313.1 type IV/VI secretion system protein, DotU family [Serratia sp. DD3]
MDGIADNPVVLIDTLLQDTWLFVLGVKNNPSAFVSEAVYRQAVTLVENANTALAQRGMAKHRIDAIIYAQCALLDETVLTRLGPTANNPNREVNPTWHAQPLQARFFSTLDAGNQLLDNIKAILYEPAPDMNVLTCYQRVLSLGFRGRLRQNEAEWQTLLDSLNALVPAFDHPISTPVIVRYRPRSRATLLHSRLLWILLAVVVTVGLITGLQLSLHQLLQSALPG